MSIIINPYKGVGALVDLNFLQSTYKVGSVRASAFNSTAIPALTVTRASVGYAETAAGVLVPFASGEARITDKGCLVEEARTNVLTYSQDFTQAAWVKQGSAAALGGQFTAPDSTLTGSTVAAGATDSSGIEQHITATGQRYTKTLYVGAGLSSRVLLGIYDATAGVFVPVTARIVSGPGTLSGTTLIWLQGLSATALTRVEIVSNAALTGSHHVYIYPDSDNSGGSQTIGNTIRLWGAQLEVGSFASSYIPTTTAPATRAADQITVSSVAVPLTNFTLYAEVALDSLAGGGYQGVAALDDGTSANQVYVFKTIGSNRARGGVDIASATVFDTASSPSTLPVLAAGVSRLAFIRAGGIVRVEANGILYPDTTQAALPVLSRLNVGRFNGNNIPANGYVRRITLMDRAVGGLTA